VFTVDELATIPLFSTLGDKELEYLAGAVEDIHLMPAEYVGHEGETRSLAIVVEGKTELTKLVNGVEQVIGVRLPGELGGEIPMTLGTPLPASMRAVEPSRVLKVTVEVFHTLAPWPLRSPQQSVPRRWSAWTCSATPPRSRSNPHCS
jgi:thioredoxin reductase (NADPH)